LRKLKKLEGLLVRYRNENSEYLWNKKYGLNKKGSWHYRATVWLLLEYSKRGYS